VTKHFHTWHTANPFSDKASLYPLLGNRRDQKNDILGSVAKLSIIRLWYGSPGDFSQGHYVWPWSLNLLFCRTRGFGSVVSVVCSLNAGGVTHLLHCNSLKNVTRIQNTRYFKPGPEINKHNALSWLSFWRKQPTWNCTFDNTLSSFKFTDCLSNIKIGPEKSLAVEIWPRSQFISPPMNKSINAHRRSEPNGRHNNLRYS
jgi:hypothetical protein